MKSNSGKSHVFFIIIIPLVLILGAIVTDTVISYTTNKKFRLITEEIIKEVTERDDLTPEDYAYHIKRLYERNNYDTENLVVEASSDRVYVENDLQYSGIFTSLFHKGKDLEEKVILGVTVRIAKNSKAFIKCEATYDSSGKLVFKYIK